MVNVGSLQRALQCWRRVLFLGLLLLGIQGNPSFAADYIYDAAGRVVAVVQQDGSSVLYQYDAVGNLIGIRKSAASTLRILQLSPLTGEIGSKLVINGSGFDTTPTANTVTINGVAASVTSATATALTVLIPAGATSGKVSVTNNSGSATSSQSFTVAASQAPTIASFSPTIGVVGTSVSITGSRFQPVAQDNKVQFGGRPAPVTSVTESSLVASSIDSSGRITVASRYGIAKSSTDFYALPSGYAATDIEVSGRIVTDDIAVTVKTTAVGKKVMLLFDGSTGQTISLGYANVVSIPSGAQFIYKVFTPGGSLLANGTLSSTNISLPVLPTTGTYTLMVEPKSATSSSITVLLSSDIRGMLPVDGSSFVLNASRVGQNGRLTFSGTAGQNLGIGYSPLTTSPVAQSVYFKLLKPDGTQLFSDFWSSPKSNNWPTLPTTGTYTLLVTPPATATATVGLLLSSDVTGTLTPDEAATTITISRIGQNARYTFNGNSGVNMHFVFANGTFTSSASVTVYQPDGSRLASTSVSSSDTLDLPALPVTGIYTVVIDPSSTVVGKVDVQLKSTLADLAASIVPDGAQLALNLAGHQRGAVTFSGTAGQNLGIGYPQITTSPARQSVSFKLLKPDGTQLFSDSAASPNSSNLPVLPATGTYTLLVTPPVTASATVGLLLSSDVTGTLTLDAAATTITIGRIGQNARYTFNGNSGVKMHFVFATGTFTSSVSVTVYKPDGSSLANTSVSSSGTFDLPALPVTGTYTVVINPGSTVIGNVDVQLKSTPTDLAASIVPDGAQVALNLAVHQRGAVTFTGTAGQNLGIGYPQITTSPTDQSVSFKLLKPDGTQLYSDSWSFANSNNWPTLPVSGTYTVMVAPPVTASANVTLTMSADQTGTLQTGGAAIVFDASRVGQNGRFTFNATANETRTLVLNGGTFPSSAAVRVNKPDGSVLTSSSVTTSGTINLANLPVSGTYTIVIDPNGATTGRVSLQLQ